MRLGTRRSGRWSGLALMSVAVLVVGAATPAAQAARQSGMQETAPAGYSIVRSTASYIAGTVRVTPEEFTDDDAYLLSTTAPGRLHLPWPIRVYGTRYNAMWVSTNGFLEMSDGGGSLLSENACLPAALNSPTQKIPALFPYWDDLYYETTTEGIFSKAFTANGVQRFLISWRGRHFFGSHPVQIEVIFTRGSNRFEYRYGAGRGQSATIGVQRTTTGPHTQFTCNTGQFAVGAGQRLTFNYE